MPSQTATKPLKVKYRRAPLYPLQEAAVFNDARISVVESSTKAGKTTACLVWLLEQALAGQQGYNYWWVAPVYPQSKIAYRRLKASIPAALYTANETELTITLLNGAVIWFKSADRPDNLFGEDVYGAVIDEASRVPEAAWHAVRTTLTYTRGPLRIIGNVRGRRNWAYNLARRAEQGEPGLAYHRITAYDAVAAGVLSGDEIEEAKRLLPPAVFEELYLAQAADDAGNPFGHAAIRACVAPLSTDQPTHIGIDLAKSIDWTVITGIDDQRRVCLYDRFQLPWEATEARITAVLRTYPHAKVLVDATGVGDPVVERLQRAFPRQVEGHVFTSPSKQRLIERLQVAIASGEIAYPEDYVGELDSFEYVYTRTGVRYQAMEGLHDDRVCSLALAVMSASQPRKAFGAW